MISQEYKIPIEEVELWPREKVDHYMMRLNAVNEHQQYQSRYGENDYDYDMPQGTPNAAPGGNQVTNSRGEQVNLSNSITRHENVVIPDNYDPETGQVNPDRSGADS